jgi:hypothetical protein
VKTERDIGHNRTQRLASAGGFVDRRDRRKNAGKECVQRAAIIGAVYASVRMRTFVMAVAIRRSLTGLMLPGVVSVAVVVIGARNAGAGRRMRLCQWRTDNTSKLGGEKERDQKPNRVRPCPAPMHGRSLSRPAAGVNPEDMLLQDSR